jgi:hypothetical protein
MQAMRKSVSFGSILILGVSLSLAASSGHSTGSTNQEKPIYKETGSEGRITGEISFVGEAPQPSSIYAGSNPVCQTGRRNSLTEDIVVSKGKLANVLVYLRSGEPLDSYTFEAHTRGVTLSRQGCQFVPHVLGMQIQQTLYMANEDPIYHNLYLKTQDGLFSAALHVNYRPLDHYFTKSEVGIPAWCNQHPSEKAYVSVFTHPFFAVSARDGLYEISGVPPGQYTIVAWHERLGEQTAEISIGVGEQKPLDFAFKPLNQ